MISCNSWSSWLRRMATVRSPRSRARCAPLPARFEPPATPRRRPSSTSRHAFSASHTIQNSTASTLMGTRSLVSVSSAAETGHHDALIGLEGGLLDERDGEVQPRSFRTIESSEAQHDHLLPLHGDVDGHDRQARECKRRYDRPNVEAPGDCEAPGYHCREHHGENECRERERPVLGRPSICSGIVLLDGERPGSRRLNRPFPFAISHTSLVSCSRPRQLPAGYDGQRRSSAASPRRSSMPSDKQRRMLSSISVSTDRAHVVGRPIADVAARIRHDREPTPRSHRARG